MSQTVDIGAARINLVVDASDMDATYARAKNAAVEFGNAAEQAFARSTGKARTAQARLLDYVQGLGAASAEQKRFLDLVKRAQSEGGDPAVLRAAQKGFNEYVAGVEVARINTESWEQMQKRAAAAARELADETKRVGDESKRAANERARLYAEGYSQQFAQNSQRDVNALVAPVLNVDSTQQAQRRADAEAAILPLLQRQEREYEQMLATAHQINNARDEQFAQQSQRSVNSLLGVQDGARSPAYLAEQRRVVEALQAQVAAEQAVEEQARDIHAQWVQIERQIQSVGKTTYQIMRENVQQKYGAAGAPLIEQINRWEKLNTTISGTTVNTKQLQQAIRFLPAQFTDIGVSLAGGMNPLLVAFQQGGQILDQFRLAGAGTADTFRMIGAYALRLVNPVTVGAAALAAFAYAAYDASKSMESLAIASAKGYGVSGDAEGLYALTESLGKLENIRLGPAEEAVARLASNGRLAGENFNLAAEATARWSSLTGESADRVASQFEAIAKDPLQAIESGLVRVTQAQYDQVKALVAVGDQQGAVNYLVKVFYDTINSNSANVEAHLSGVSRLMQSIKDDFSAATRFAGNFANTIIDEVGAANVKLAATGNLAQALVGYMAKLRSEGAQGKPDFSNVRGDPLADPAAQERERQRARAIEDFLVRNDEQAQRRITINRMREEGKRLGLTVAQTEDAVKRQEAAWAKADAKRTRTSTRSGGGTGARTAARDVRYDYQLESAMLQTQTREVQAAYAIKKISAESYYKSLLTLAQQEFDIQKRSNAEQLAAVAGKKGQEHEVARLRVADALAEQQLAQRTIDIQSQQAQYMRQLEQERRSYTNGLRDSVQAQQEEYDIAVNRLTMGNREFERWSATNELRREEARLLRQISRDQEDGAITAEEAERRKQEAIQATIDKLGQTAGMYARIDAAQADWSVGASRAWKNWQDDVADVASQSERFFDQALNGFADATTDALTGNLSSWGDYFDGLARMITQFIVKQKLTDWIKSLNSGQAGGGGGGIWGFLGNLAGALFGGGGGAGAGGATAAAPSSFLSWIGAGYADGGQIPANSIKEVNERGFEMANIGSKQYLLTGSRPVQITPNHKLTSQPQPSKTITIIQNNKFDVATDKSTRDQIRRDQAAVTQKAVSKV